MYKLVGIKLVFKGTPNNADINDVPVCVDISLNDNQLGEVVELIGSFSQQAVEDGQACMHCEDWTILPGTIYSYCPDCGRSLPPAA